MASKVDNLKELKYKHTRKRNYLLKSSIAIIYEVKQIEILKALKIKT